jgi:2-polyprenyl-6-methoxyphenol hydroxylase-like FAD-dependent oxidoreductase
MHALVMGDGIAGLGAAIVLARAGWQVTLAGPRRGKLASHRSHAHLTSAAVLCQLERTLGGALEGWARGAALVWDESGPRDAADRPILAAEALRESLAVRAAEAGVGFHTHGTVTALPNGASWLWSSGDRGKDADLVVDATGSGHWLGRMAGVAVCVDELAGTDRCWSWTGLNDGPAKPWLLAARGRAQSALLLRGPDGRIRLTLRQPGPAAPDPLAALDRLLVNAGAQWAERIGTIALDPRQLRHDSPLARRTLLSLDTPLPPLVRLGDGLIQTAPRLGQGIAQIAEQLEALANALAARMPIPQWQAQLDVLADRRWAGLMLGAGLGRIAA